MATTNRSVGTLVLRTDATVAMGTGHVMRCLALAQAWQDEGGDVVFAMAQTTAAVADKLRAERCHIAAVQAVPGCAQDAAQTAEIARGHAARWIAIDGYQFDSEYQRSLKESGFRLLCVDDTGQSAHYFADLVLNQNVHANESTYAKREAYTRLLLGSRFAMMRREFGSWWSWQRLIPQTGRKILVTMGGSDPDSFTMIVLRALQMVNLEGLEAIVVAGGSNPHFDLLEDYCKRSLIRVSLLKNASNMPELMAWADLGVSAAGTTCWEMCLLGLPMLLVDLAENQRPSAVALQQRKVGVHLGSSRTVSVEEIASQMKRILLSKDQRSEMSERARVLVDGRGAHRVRSAIFGATLSLRPVEEKDCRLLWEWANDPEVRAASFCSGPIPWDDHCRWLETKLHESGTAMFIATGENGVPMGQIRLDRVRDGEAQIGVSIARERRGSGLAAPVIEAVGKIAFEDLKLARLHAFIKLNNPGSSRAFEAAGFRRLETLQWMGSDALHYTLDRDPERGA